MKTNPEQRDIRFAFFGTSHIAVMVLDALDRAGFHPALVITMPPQRQGRGLERFESAVALWAHARHLPLSYDWSEFEASAWDVAIVVDYGKILPKQLLALPHKGFINVHPSLLPRYRGPSPMRTAILHDDQEVGVSIMLLDEEMDHGPLLAQKKIPVTHWPPKNSDLERILLPEAGALLAQVLPAYVRGEIDPQPQNHDVATYTNKFTKADGLLDLRDDPKRNLLKVRAFEGWPGAYTFIERAGKRIRVQILDATLKNGAFVPLVVKPEGKKEMTYEALLRGNGA